MLAASEGEGFTMLNKEVRPKQPRTRQAIQAHTRRSKKFGYARCETKRSKLFFLGKQKTSQFFSLSQLGTFSLTMLSRLLAILIILCYEATTLIATEGLE